MAGTSAATQRRLAPDALPLADHKLLWKPQPKQALLLSCPVFEVLFGGARGGGKTDGALGDFLQHASRYPQKAKGIIVRREFVQLEDIIERSHHFFTPLGWKFVGGTKPFWRSPKGALLRFRHLKNAQDAEKYQGHNYNWCCFEELTNWPTPDAYNMMRAVLRSAEGIPTYLRGTANPGGAGHNWVKNRFVTPAPFGFKVLVDHLTGLDYCFIPSRLDDNQILMSNNPAYERQILAAGGPALVRAWRWGDWDIVAGGFFDDLFRPDKHIVSTFDPPRSWRRRMSFDWGSAAPASTGFWAISDGTPATLLDGSERYFPRGSVIRFKEWYTIARDEQGFIKPNVGLRLSNEHLGETIAQQMGPHLYTGSVADPSIFSEQGGPSIYEQMKKGSSKAGRNLSFTRADNNRIAGWQLMRQYMEAAANDDRERPGLYVMDNCEHWLRTVPVLQRDANSLDDVDTEGEDHAGDETRYLVMSTKKRIGQQTF